MTREYLDCVLAAQPRNTIGFRNRALLSIGYDLLARRAELTALRVDDLTWRNDGWLQVLIRRGKSDPFGGGRIAFTSVDTRELVDAWLDARGPHIPWLFCPVYFGKPVARPLCTSTVRDIVKSGLDQAGFDRAVVKEFSGHSLRVGAAQDLLAKGHDTAAIMRAGGWKSTEVLARYLEAAEHNVWA